MRDAVSFSGGLRRFVSPYIPPRSKGKLIGIRISSGVGGSMELKREWNLCFSAIVKRGQGWQRGGSDEMRGKPACACTVGKGSAFNLLMNRC